MQQPFPLPVGETMDFKFDFTDLITQGDSIASYILSSSGLTLSSPSTAAGYVTFFAKWTSAAAGDSGYVICTATSTLGRIIPAKMTFFATPYAP